VAFFNYTQDMSGFILPLLSTMYAIHFLLLQNEGTDVENIVAIFLCIDNFHLLQARSLAIKHLCFTMCKKIKNKNNFFFLLRERKHEVKSMISDSKTEQLMTMMKRVWKEKENKSLLVFFLVHLLALQTNNSGSY
jgi:hypothetical protein